MAKSKTTKQEKKDFSDEVREEMNKNKTFIAACKTVARKHDVSSREVMDNAKV